MNKENRKVSIIYQGDRITTAATSLAELSAELKLDTAHTILELNGEIFVPGSAQTRPLLEGAVLNAFRIVAGG